MRTILLAGGCSLALSGCLPAAAGLALSAASLVTGGGDGKGGNGFTNPIDRQTTGRQVRQALSRLDEQVDPACQAMLDEHQRNHGTLVAGNAAQSTDPAPDPSPNASSDAISDAGAGKQAPPPVNLLAKLEPVPDAAAGAEVSVAADSAAPGPAEATADPTVPAAGQDTESAGSGVSSADGETASVAADPATADAQPVKASLDTTPAPGQCEHRFVCLPGTPKPTLMLMCPGKGKRGADPETTTASGSSDAPADTETTEGGQPAAASSETAAASAPADVPARDDAPVRQTIEGGGVSDWNWSYDPSKQL